MTLLRLQSSPLILIEDYENTNTVPLVQELTSHIKTTLHFFCYEQPIFIWKKVLKGLPNVIFHKEFEMDSIIMYGSEKCTIFVDSINQMVLDMGWNQCIRTLKTYMVSPYVNKVILNLHVDCLFSSSKIRRNLNHIASGILSFDKSNPCLLHIVIKKSGKVVKSDELLSYDTRTSTLKLTPVVNDKKSEEEPEKPLPQNLTTFKIEVDQSEKLEKYKLQLPYMSKINEGESKIFYEPDAVDDWDEEDPDDDLNI